MPRTSQPILPESQLINSCQTEIDRHSWQTVRNQIIELYEQRLQDYFQNRGLSLDEISKKRLKRLSENEILTLSLCFLTRIIELHQQGQDTEETIRQLCQDETELLERGYPKPTIAKNHHPLYINLVRDAISAEPSRSTIATHQLVLNQQNSWLIAVPNKDTGELEEISIHYVQMYLKYDTPFYVNLRRSTTANNNIKQEHPQPVRLDPYLETVRQLLNSNSYTELATAIAAASGRRFTEIVKGSFSLPPNSAYPYEYLFEGQLKKKNQAPAYLPYSIVPASQLLEAIARFRSLPKIQPLLSATSTKINQSINPAVKYQVEKHFQHPGIVRVLKRERGVTVQNLRGIYGEIATHFFCPHRASFHRFLSLRLGHLIGDEAVASPNSPSTEHYFHYYLVDEEGKQIDSMGVLLDKSGSEELSSGENPQPQTTTGAVGERVTNDPRTIVHTRASTKERFNHFRGKDMTENDTLITLMNKAEKAEVLEQELKNARALISSVEAQLDSSIPESYVKLDSSSIAGDNPESTPSPNSNSSFSTSGEPHSIVENNTNDAVLLLVRSMSQLTNKLELFLDRQIIETPPSSADPDNLPPSEPKEPVDQHNSVADTIALLNRAIDTIMAHNDRALTKADKWYIGINPLKDIINSQVTISRVVKRRKAEINAHHQKHHLDRYHNGNFHREQGYTDFFDFD
ncbi:hypothetical protein H1P_3330008 [Hyella patelloides LEGE 07179]|uniref:Telomere resolvase ResT/TelK catalytic domain-containing protein n=1 Tax=Hyella patelloides LEGE 07179 TaxID=945734 RepID=A0A563VVZ1_9CYAN|nr:protelomerase family protein [Hyella patelloides]VEP15423.1 hypothetical protein H1P_3330008 [Hyella patelloides LEGE 07179]